MIEGPNGPPPHQSTGIAAGKRISLHSLFMRHQKRMRAELSQFRYDVPHPTAKGDGGEECWLKMLRKYLPNRYDVESGFVVDCEGALSDQIDIVIFDQQYTPFLFTENGVNYVPAESVYAVLEVKQELTKAQVEYAGKKAASVRRLRRTSAKIRHAGGTYKEPKELHWIPAGIVTLDSSWRPSPLGNSFAQIIRDLPSEERLDLGCVLNGGSFTCRFPEDAEAEIDVSRTEDALITFFLRLMAELQHIGTAPAMDLTEWEQPLSL